MDTRTLAAHRTRSRRRTLGLAAYLLMIVPIGILLWLVAAAAVTGLAEAVTGVHADAPAAAPAAPAAPAVGQRPASGLGCWTEDKTDGNPPEQICGNVKLAPRDAHDFTPYPE